MKNIIVICGMITIMALIAGCSKSESKTWSEELILKDYYSEIFNDVVYIEIGNGMTGEGKTIEDNIEVKSIVDRLSEVKANKRANQEDRTGWMYSIKCYSSKEEWFELVIGGSIISDNIKNDDGTRSWSPYYELVNTEKLIEYIDTLYTEYE